MSVDRTGQIWRYCESVFFITGSPSDGRIWKDRPNWVDHPIVWLDDTITDVRTGRVDGFLEYNGVPWEEQANFKRIA